MIASKQQQLLSPEEVEDLSRLINSIGASAAWLQQMPAWVIGNLLSCPLAGTGVHSWLFRCAILLRRYCQDEALLAEILDGASDGCGRVVPEREIQDAVRNSAFAQRRTGYHDPHRLPTATTAASRIPKPTWPARNLDHILKFGQEGPTMPDLRALSATDFSRDPDHAIQILDALFPGDPLLCIGWEPWKFTTKPKSWWHGTYTDRQFIVPSPMILDWGFTKNGRPSDRTLQNCGPRRFLVVEFDFRMQTEEGKETPEAPILRTLANSGRSIKDLCAALTAHLAQYAPLTAVVDSGGKSLHAWFPAVGVPDAMLLRFMRYAVSIGADPATWVRCQFVRLPGGLRSNGTRQEVVFFKPQTLPI